MDYLSRTEELLLLVVWRLQDDAYGLTIRRMLCELTGEEMSVGTVYSPLKRLARAGFLETWDSEPVGVRGGRSKRHYRLSDKGVRALSAVKALSDNAWEGLSLATVR